MEPCFRTQTIMIMNWEPCGKKTRLEFSQDPALGFFQITCQSAIWSLNAFDFGNATSMTTAFSVVEIIDVSQKQGITRRSTFPVPDPKELLGAYEMVN